MRSRALLVLTSLLCGGAALGDAGLRQAAIDALAQGTANARTQLFYGRYPELPDVFEGTAEGKPITVKAKIEAYGVTRLGETALRAYRCTGDAGCLSLARSCADLLVDVQTEHGGWGPGMSFTFSKPGEPPRLSTSRAGSGAFDDNSTQGPVTLLMEMAEETKETRYREAVERALALLLKAQFPNGAWTQYYPLIGGYSDHYTFNDSAINDCIRVMREAYDRYGDAKYLGSTERGGDFIIASQRPAPQAGWAQQYSHDMKPAWARSYEPPSVCSAVTRNNIRTLMEVYLGTGKEKYLAPIPAAIEWLEASPIAPDTWARFYELETNEPLYYDRGQKRVSDWSELSEERRTGYGYRGSFGVPETIAAYRELKRIGRERTLRARQRPMTAKARRVAMKELELAVRQAIESQVPWGGWLTERTTEPRGFIEPARRLCGYLELAG